MEKHFKLTHVAADGLSPYNPYNVKTSFTFREIATEVHRLDLTDDSIQDTPLEEVTRLLTHQLQEKTNEQYAAEVNKLRELIYTLKTGMKPNLTAFDLVPIITRCEDLALEVINKLHTESDSVKLVNMGDLAAALDPSTPMYRTNGSEREHLFRGKHRH